MDGLAIDQRPRQIVDPVQRHLSQMLDRVGDHNYLVSGTLVHVGRQSVKGATVPGEPEVHTSGLVRETRADQHKHGVGARSNEWEGLGDIRWRVVERDPERVLERMAALD